VVEALGARVFQIARQRLYKLIAEFLLERAYPNDRRPLDSRIESMGFFGSDGELSVRLRSALPLIGIGAPTHIFLPEVARALETECVIPPDAGVANAIGAITGSVLSEQTVLVKPHYDAQGINGYSCHGSGGYARFDQYDEAIAWARDEAENAARREILLMGAQDIQTEVTVCESSGKAAGEGARELLLETRAVARAMGKPRLYL
jgi:N-methylhydantoinase A/oxoprolinase/acetone carboxylase beta subunit